MRVVIFESTHLEDRTWGREHEGAQRQENVQKLHIVDDSDRLGWITGYATMLA